MWTSIKATGDTKEINMEDYDKPQMFDSKDEEIEWSRHKVQKPMDPAEKVKVDFNNFFAPSLKNQKFCP